MAASETSPVSPVPSGLEPDEVPELPCRDHDHDPDMWFAESPLLLERAKRLCGECPVRRNCLDGALARREPWGVWGGAIVSNGVVLAVKRGRGRPPRSRPSGPGAPDAGARGALP